MKTTLDQIKSSGEGVTKRTDYTEIIMVCEDKMEEFGDSVKNSDILLK